MAVLLLTKRAQTIREAARLVADKAEGVSTSAKVDRLRSKYAQRREQLEAKVRAALDRRRKSTGGSGRSNSAATLDRNDAARLDPPSAAAMLDDSIAARIQRDYENSAVTQTMRLMEQRRRMLNPDSDSAVEAAIRYIRKLEP